MQMVIRYRLYYNRKQVVTGGNLSQGAECFGGFILSEGFCFMVRWLSSESILFDAFDLRPKSICVGLRSFLRSLYHEVITLRLLCISYLFPLIYEFFLSSLKPVLLTPTHLLDLLLLPPQTAILPGFFLPRCF